MGVEYRPHWLSENSESIIFTIKVLVFLDLFAVAILVPLLPSYFRNLGISTELYGLVSSVYSAAQVIFFFAFLILNRHIL